MVGSSCCPFVAGAMLTERRYFVGRRSEIKAIIESMTNDQPTSVNIVGDRRIGKSSLLHHIYQTYEERVPQYQRRPDEFVVVYASLKDAVCRNPVDFYQNIARQLLARVGTNGVLAQPLQVNPFDGQSFFRAMEAWKVARVLPVVCLDDFEELLKDRTQFDDGFYDNLRSLVDRSALMLVIASRQSLKQSRQQYRFTSGFFNLFQTRRLAELAEEEARDLVRLPSNDNAALSEPRRELALQWAGTQPFLLQLAGRCLWEAKAQDKPNDWARRLFEQDAIGVPRRRNAVAMTMGGVARLGRFGQALGGATSEWGDFGKGLAILVVFGLLILGLVKKEEFAGLLKKHLNGILDNTEMQGEPQEPQGKEIKHNGR
jgi:uncharacterized protein